MVRQYETGTYTRVYYTKNDSDNTVTIDKQEECFIVDVNADELSALEALQAIKGTYSATLDEIKTIQANYEQLQNTQKEEKENFDAKISELTEQNSTLETEKDNFSAKVDSLTEENQTLTTEVEALRSYKLDAEDKMKKSILAKYTEQLGEDVIAEFAQKLNDYSVEDLKKELAYTLVGDNPETFSKKDTPHVPKEPELNGLEVVLEKYKK